MVFHPLGRDQIRGIADIQLAILRRRLAESELALEVNEDVMDKLTEAGFDPVYGARPLKRAIQQLIENPLSQDVISGRFVPGDVIQAKIEEDKVVFGD